MKRFAAVFLMLIVAVPSFAKTHKDVYSVPCSTLWPAVKDTLRNSGKYDIFALDKTEMTAEFAIRMLPGVDSVVLHGNGKSCEMQVQLINIGLVHSTRPVDHDYEGDFKKHVDKSLAQLQPSQPTAPAKPRDPTK